MESITVKTIDRLVEAATGGEDISKCSLYSTSPTAAAREQQKRAREQEAIRREVSPNSVQPPHIYN